MISLYYFTVDFSFLSGELLVEFDFFSSFFLANFISGLAAGLVSVACDTVLAGSAARARVKANIAIVEINSCFILVLKVECDSI